MHCAKNLFETGLFGAMGLKEYETVRAELCRK
jgi:hypothetical protein